MTSALTIARRELMSYLVTPVGYVVTALFLFFTSLIYFGVAPLLLDGGFSPGQPASLRLFFQVGIWVFFLVGPVISMRTISEEIRTGTLESLMTAPVSEGQVIFGKYLGSLGFFVVMLVPTLVYVFALERFGRPDYGEVLSGYLGLLLVASAFLASGILASTLTSSQVLACITTIFFWLIVIALTIVFPQVIAIAEGALAVEDERPLVDAALAVSQSASGFLEAGSPIARLRGFVDGLVDSFGVVYFLSLTGVFLFAAVKSLSLRRLP